MAKQRTSKREIKEKAQDQLIFGLRSAFALAGDDGVCQAVLDEMSKQFERVEKMFGYEPGSNPRGV